MHAHQQPQNQGDSATGQGRGLDVAGTRLAGDFAHEFKPKFIEAGLLADSEMLAQVTAVNRQIQALAPLLNSPDLPGSVTVKSSVADVPVEAVVKRDREGTYVFAVGMRNGETSCEFKMAGLSGRARAEVLGEMRSLDVQDGEFKDTFSSWDVHLYRIRAD